MTGPALLILLAAIIGAIAAFWQNARTANERADFEKELRTRSDELRNKSDEIASLNQEIAKSQRELRAEVEKQVQLQQELRKRAEEQVRLQRELRLKSDEIAKLNQRIADSVTGGDSYCYVSLTAFGLNNAVLVIIHQGSYPLYDVSIRIVDIDKSKRLMEEQQRRGEQLTLETTRPAEVTLNVGNLSPGQATLSQTISIPSGDTIKYNIFIAARNGMFTELLRFRRVDGDWKAAMKVQRNNYSEKTPQTPPTLLKEQIANDYPRNRNGEVEWD